MCDCQQLIGMLFLRLPSGVCQTSMSARIVFNWLCWLLTKSYWAVSCHTTAIVMLSTDLATFGAIYSTNGSIWRYHYLACVFPCHFVAPHDPQPTTPM